MKNKIILLAAGMLVLSCSPRVDTFVSRKYQGFTTYYNTLFNSKDALETDLANQKKGYQDNFYVPYIHILKINDQPLGTNLSSVFSDNGKGVKPEGKRITKDVVSQLLSNPQAVVEIMPASGTSNGVASPAQNPTQKQGSSILEISEAKALKAISKHSMEFGNVQRNKEIFEAYLLLAQSRLYQGKKIEAMNALNYLFAHMSNDKRIDLAKIYRGETFAKMGDYFRANELFKELSDKKKLKKEYRKLLTVYYAQMLVDTGKLDDALDELGKAFKVNKNHELRSRIAFLRGQILLNKGEKEAARASFVTAYKYANDFPFEVRTQVEIAKTLNQADDYEALKKYLEKNSKKGIYESRKNEFLYALGILAKEAGNETDADKFFRESLKGKASDPQLRGLAYYEIGKNLYNKNEYLASGVYYDSAIAVMTFQPKINELKLLSANIKKLSADYFLMKKNDSILALTKMSPDERNKYFEDYIAKLKAKEEQAALQQQKEQKEKSFQEAQFTLGGMDFTNNQNQPSSGFANNPGNAKRFYFDNPSTVAQGESDFKQVWGQRALSDNWRYSAKVASIADLKNEAMGVKNTGNPRRFEISYYTEQIPTAPTKLAELKQQRDTAQLGMGIMYFDNFDNRPLATKTLYNLVDLKPDQETELKALYQIFAMNYQQHADEAERAKDLILKDFPYTPYAEFVKNPRSTNFLKSDEAAVKDYVQAFDLYEKGKFQDSQQVIDSAILRFPKDALIPKFYLLQAYNTGKLNGKEVMILQLNQIILNYPKTNEGEKAAEVLNFLKSDLSENANNKDTNRTKQTSFPDESSTLRYRIKIKPKEDNPSAEPETQENPVPTQPAINSSKSKIPPQPKPVLQKQQ